MDSLLRGGLEAVKEIDDSVKAELERTVRLRPMGLLLESPRPGWKQEVSALLKTCGWAELEQDTARVLEGWTEGRYLALFGPGGAVSPRGLRRRPKGGTRAGFSPIFRLFTRPSHFGPARATRRTTSL